MQRYHVSWIEIDEKWTPGQIACFYAVAKRQEQEADNQK